MEGFDWSGLFDTLLPALAGAVMAALVFALTRIRSLVRESENKWDDALLKAFDEGYQAAKDKDPVPPAE